MMSNTSLNTPAADAAGIEPNGLQRFGEALMKIGAWPGKMSSWLILPIIASVLIAVIGGIYRLAQLASWEMSLPLLGKQLSIIGLSELQWHMFALMVMFGASYALEQNSHVRVDMTYAKLGPKGKAVVDLIGDLVLLLPFCAIVGWLSIRFVEMSFASGEKSDYGGLIDRYMIKAVMPIGLALLFLTGFGRVLRSIGVLISKSSPGGSNVSSNQK